MCGICVGKTSKWFFQGRSGMALEDLVREEVMELIDLFKEKVGANGTKLWYDFCKKKIFQQVSIF